MLMSFTGFDSKDVQNKDICLSVIIPCFNQGKFIREAISSVEYCKNKIYEIIIINDGSTEPLTCQVLNHLKQEGYLVIDQENQGAAAARNQGIKAAKGQYILPLDADDKIKPEYISKGIEILDNCSEVGVVYGDIEFFSERALEKIFKVGEGYGKIQFISGKSFVWNLPNFNCNLLVLHCYMAVCAVFRKSIWEDCGGYDTHIPFSYGEDWEFWLRVAKKKWDFYHIPEVLFYCRISQNSQEKLWNVPQNRKIAVRYIRKKHLDLYLRALLSRTLSIWRTEGFRPLLARIRRRIRGN